MQKNQVQRSPSSLGTQVALKRVGAAVENRSMHALRGTLCFTCGLAVGAPPRLNKLEDGSACPSCMDRVLNSLPAALPGAAGVRGDDSPSSPAREGLATAPEGERGSGPRP